MNKKIFIFLMMGAVVGGSLLVFQASAQAQTDPPQDYTVLAPLPGTTDCGPITGNEPPGYCRTTLQQYLPGLFNLAIGLSAVFAVLMIVIGGFQYMSTDAIMKKEEGKRRIMNSIYGLILVIGAWLILYTINPALLELHLEISPVTTSAPSTNLGSVSNAGTPMTTDQILASNTIRAALSASDVYAYRDPCTNGQTTECVNLNGLTNTTTGGLISLKQNCGTTCGVIITGGTEGGHAAGSDHYAGTAVDLRMDATLTNYVMGNAIGNPVQTSIGPKYTLNINGRTVYFTNESATASGSTGAHWHVVFP